MDVITGRNIGATEQMKIHFSAPDGSNWFDFTLFILAEWTGKTQAGPRAVFEGWRGGDMFAIKIYIHFPRLVNVRSISLQGLSNGNTRSAPVERHTHATDVHADKTLWMHDYVFNPTAPATVGLLASFMHEQSAALCATLRELVQRQKAPMTR